MNRKMISHASEPAVEIVHFADPWCWWSWGLEPILQHLREAYGDQVKITYRMGGITDNVSEWRKEYDVTEDDALRTWITESTSATAMPADPEYYLNTKVKSTLPACAAVKAAQIQSEDLGERFFRRLMETIQLESKNGSDETVYLKIAREVGLDLARLKRDISSGRASKLLEEDRRAMNVNFLTLTYINTKTRKVKDVGNAFTAAEHDRAVEEVTDGILTKKTSVDILDYFERHKGFTMPAKEIAEVFSISEYDAKSRLLELAAGGLLERREFAFGVTCWSLTEKTGKEKLTLALVKASHLTGPTQGPGESSMTETITKAVKGLYTQVANDPHKVYHFPVGRSALLQIGYPKSQIDKMPESALESFAGVGYPHQSGLIRPADTVLDIGSGSGTDVLFASLLTGVKGKIFGLDITDAMIEKARSNISKMGASNIKIVKGDATNIPLEDASVDMVTSNGVLNLVPDKERAFREIYRILKPDGRIQISDIVVQTDVQKVCGLVPQLWADCIGGAAVESEYLETIRKSGFRDVHVINRLDYFSASPSENTRRLTKTFAADSVVITGRKPK